MGLTLNAALRRASTLKGEVKMLSERLGGTVSFPVADPPAYSFEETLNKLADTSGELMELQAGIQTANASLMIDWQGKSVSGTWAIRRLQELKSLITIMRGLDCRPRKDFTSTDSQWCNKSDEYIRVPVDNHCSFTTRQRDEAVSRMQGEFDELNALLESANHTNALPSVYSGR
jgi:hypothetical protein